MKGKNILIVLLILIIIGLIGFICYDKGVFKKQTKETNTEEKEKKVETKEISLDSPEVEKAMKILESIYISEPEFYKDKSYNINNISNYDLIATSLNVSGVSKYIAYCIGSKDQLKENFSIDELNKNLDKYILDKKITIDTIKSLKNESSYPLAQYEVNNIGFIVKGENIQLVGPCGAEGPYDFTDSKSIKAELNDEYLYIYEKKAFAKWKTDEATNDLILDYYKDYNRKEVVDKNIKDEQDENEEYNHKLNWDSYNTYKYTFKIIDNNYYFQSFELV